MRGAVSDAGASAPPPPSALLVGIYGKYKNSTNFFKRWLLAAGLTLGAPTMLTPSQLHAWPRALAACQSVITLRERAALFFPAHPNDSHAHFLSCLKEWLLVLQETTRPMVAKQPKAEQPLDFANYYEVLALPDDYFDEEEVFAVPALKPSKSTKATAAQRKKLFDEAFTEDLNAELACLMMELEELCEGVYAV